MCFVYVCICILFHFTNHRFSFVEHSTCSNVCLIFIQVHWHHLLNKILYNNKQWREWKIALKIIERLCDPFQRQLKVVKSFLHFTLNNLKIWLSIVTAHRVYYVYKIYFMYINKVWNFFFFRHLCQLLVFLYWAFSFSVSLLLPFTSFPLKKTQWNHIIILKISIYVFMIHNAHNCVYFIRYWRVCYYLDLLFFEHHTVRKIGCEQHKTTNSLQTEVQFFFKLKGNVKYA